MNLRGSHLSRRCLAYNLILRGLNIFPRFQIQKSIFKPCFLPDVSSPHITLQNANSGFTFSFSLTKFKLVEKLISFAQSGKKQNKKTEVNHSTLLTTQTYLMIFF